MRKYYAHKKLLVFLDPIVMCVLGSLIALYLPILSDERCQPVIKGLEHIELQRFNCEPGHFSPLTSLLFNTESNTVKGLIKYGDILKPSTNFFFMLFWLLLTSVTYGAMIPAGLFIPSILIGCSMGHLLGSLLQSWEFISEYQSQTFAVIGAATVIAGITRTSLALAILMMETSQDVNLFIPIMMSIIISISVGN